MCFVSAGFVGDKGPVGFPGEVRAASLIVIQNKFRFW